MDPCRAKELFQEHVRQIREGTYPYLPRPPTAFPWSLYDRAQTHELPDFLNMCRRAVDQLAWEVPEAPRHSPRGGQPAVPLYDLVKALLLQTYLGHPNRRGESDLTALAPSLGLSRTFSYQTLARGFERRDVRRALLALLFFTNRPVQGREETFTLDGSGFPTSVRFYYRGLRERQSAQAKADDRPGGWPGGIHDWVCNVANLGVRYDLVAGWASWTQHEVGEVSVFPRVFTMTRSMHPRMRLQLGDGAYSARWVVGMCAAAGVECRFLPRRGTSLKSLGEPAWSKAHWGLVVDPQGWLEDYHLRSNSEVGWSSLKARHPEKIRKKRAVRQETEALLRPVAYNLRRLGYWRWLERDESFADFSPRPPSHVS